MTRQISVRVDDELVERAEALVSTLEVSAPGGATLTAVWRAAMIRGVRELEADLRREEAAQVRENKTATRARR